MVVVDYTNDLNPSQPTNNKGMCVLEAHSSWQFTIPCRVLCKDLSRARGIWDIP